METGSLWKILDSVQAQIRVFDAKAQIVIAIDGVLAGFFGTQTVKIAELVAARPLSPISVYLTFVGLACLVALVSSVMLAVATVHPRLHLNQPNSRVFFAHIYNEFKNDFTKVRQALITVPDDEFRADLANQILANSIICCKKAHRFKYALFTMSAAVIFWIATLFLQFGIQRAVATSVAATSKSCPAVAAGDTQIPTVQNIYNSPSSSARPDRDKH